MGRKVKQATPFAEHGKRLKAFRLWLGEYLKRDDFMVLARFADELGMSANGYGNFETGARAMTLETARVLKDKFEETGVDLDFLCDGDLDCFPYMVSARIEQIEAKL